LKSRFVVTRVESEVRWLIENVAVSAGLTVSEYIRHLIVNDLAQKGILLDRASRKLMSPVAALNKEGFTADE